jgi:Asp-tRNA(Asn)/Glu-tRNA(Gln) amidotransferase A subunit family amidase
VPALARPAGSAEGLPVSLHLACAEGADARLLALGRWAESAMAPAG